MKLEIGGTASVINLGNTVVSAGLESQSLNLKEKNRGRQWIRDWVGSRNCCSIKDGEFLGWMSVLLASQEGLCSTKLVTIAVLYVVCTAPSRVGGRL